MTLCGVWLDVDTDTEESEAKQNREWLSFFLYARAAGALLIHGQQIPYLSLEQL